MGLAAAIQSVTEADVCALIQRGTHPDLDVDFLEDAVAGVDWSGVTAELSQPARLIGAIEHDVTLFREGDISESELAGRLAGLLADSSSAGRTA